MDTLTRRPLLWITTLAALLRLPTLAIESLWYDETFTAWLANLPLDALIVASQGDVHPPTWYILEWLVVHALGPSEFALRLISALAGIALIPAVWRLGLVLNVERSNVERSTLLAAIAPFAVYYSQDARMYSLLMLALTVALISLLEQRWFWFVACSVFALYLHNLAVLSLAAICWVGLYRFWRNGWLYASFSAIYLAWLPWLLFGLLPQFDAVSTAFWVRPPTYGTPVFVLTALLWSEKALLLGWVTIPLVALGLYRAAAAQPGCPKIEPLALLIIPLALAVIVSVLVTPILVPRIVAFAAIPLYLILGPALLPASPGAEKTGSQFHATLLPATLLLCCLIAFYAAYWLTDRIGRYPWDIGLPPNVVNSTDGIYHANLATYIVYHYYLPNEQFVWRQANDLSQSLTDQTKAAMGMRQANFEEVACRHTRWWLAFYENPTTGEGERAEVARLVQQYQGREVARMFKNQLVNARLYLLEGVCQERVEVQ